MSLGLLLLAVAVLLWPGRRRLDRARLATDDVGGPLGRLAAPFRRLPVPLVAGCAAAATASLVSTGLVAGVAGLCGVLAARAWIAGRRAAREQADLASLAEALGALGAELRSGRSLEAAAPAAAAAGGNERCGRALVLAVRAPDVAVPTTPGPLEQALARISSAVLLSGRTGCSLASIVGAVEDDLRARLRHARELRAATAGPRSSAFLLAGLPLLGLLMGSGVGADPWHVLTATGPGNALLVAGVGLEIAGVAWSGQLVERALR